MEEKKYKQDESLNPIVKELKHLNQVFKHALELQYALALAKTLRVNKILPDRTGTSIYYGGQRTFTISPRELRQGVPKLIGKKVFPHLGFKEMFWFINGKTDKHSLNELGVHYWDNWFKEDGTIGKSYGYQFRREIDQFATLIKEMEDNPYSRRLMINLWNPDDLEDMALPPCFFNYQFCLSGEYANSKSWDLIVSSRSADAFLGVPYNFLSSYFLGEVVLASVETPYSNYLRNITWHISNFHIYTNHREQVLEYLNEVISFYSKYKSKPSSLKLNKGKLDLHEEEEIEDFVNYLQTDELELKDKTIVKFQEEEYTHSPKLIKAEISV